MDLTKAYTVTELLNMNVSELQQYLNIVKVQYFNYTEEETELINKAKEIIEAPYQYAVNHFKFHIDKQEEAIARDKEIEDILSGYSCLMMNTMNKIPSEVKETLRNYNKMKGGLMLSS